MMRVENKDSWIEGNVMIFKTWEDDSREEYNISNHSFVLLPLFSSFSVHSCFPLPLPLLLFICLLCSYSILFYSFPHPPLFIFIFMLIFLFWRYSDSQFVCPYCSTFISIFIFLSLSYDHSTIFLTCMYVRTFNPQAHPYLPKTIPYNRSQWYPHRKEYLMEKNYSKIYHHGSWTLYSRWE